MRYAHRSGKHTVSGSHIGDFHRQFNTNIVRGICDLGLDYDDDLIQQLEKYNHRYAKMLTRGTGKLRKCKECGEVYVNASLNEGKFGTWYNKHGFVCMTCRANDKEGLKKRPKEYSELMKKIWDLYISRINRGVIITKVNN